MRSKKTIASSLSPFEWTIMNQVWSSGTITVREIEEALPSKQRRAYTTLQTYLERLVDKKFLQKEKIGLVNFYSVIVEKENVVREETSRFVDRVFNGSATQLAAFLIDHNTLSPDDLDKIKSMLSKEENSDD